MNSKENAVQLTVREEIEKIIHEIGVPSHIMGYQFLCDAILHVIDDPSMIKSISKKLYPSIAEGTALTASQVQCAISQAIEVASGRGRELFANYFGESNWLKPPANREFILKIADVVEQKIN